MSTNLFHSHSITNEKYLHGGLKDASRKEIIKYCLELEQRGTDHPYIQLISSEIVVSKLSQVLLAKCYCCPNLITQRNITCSGQQATATC